MNIDFKKINLKSLSDFDIKKIIDVLARTWQKIHTFVFFVLLAISIALGIYIWQNNIYGGGWTDDRKQEFLNSQNRGIIFRKDEFQRVINDIQRRQSNVIQDNKQLKDIFKPYK